MIVTPTTATAMATTTRAARAMTGTASSCSGRRLAEPPRRRRHGRVSWMTVAALGGDADDVDDVAAARESDDRSRARATGLPYTDTASTREYEFALAAAIASENYAEAARVRDILRARGETNARRVADANAAFYDAFRSGDIEVMKSMWARDAPHAQCAHPGSAVVSGYDDVVESWAVVFASAPAGAGFDVRASDVRVHAGDGWGFVTCVECVGDAGARLAATNIFERQPDGDWAIVLHQAHGVVGLR